MPWLLFLHLCKAPDVLSDKCRGSLELPYHPNHAKSIPLSHNLAGLANVRALTTKAITRRYAEPNAKVQSWRSWTFFGQQVCMDEWTSRRLPVFHVAIEEAFQDDCLLVSREFAVSSLVDKYAVSLREQTHALVWFSSFIAGHQIPGASQGE